LEAIVRFETQEYFRHPHVVTDTTTDAAGVVEDESSRHTIDPVEQVLESVRHAPAVSPPKS